MPRAQPEWIQRPHEAGSRRGPRPVGDLRDPIRVYGPDVAAPLSVLKCEEEAYEKRVREIQQTHRCAMMPHSGVPLQRLCPWRIKRVVMVTPPKFIDKSLFQEGRVLPKKTRLKKSTEIVVGRSERIRMPDIQQGSLKCRSEGPGTARVTSKGPLLARGEELVKSLGDVVPRLNLPRLVQMVWQWHTITPWLDGMSPFAPYLGWNWVRVVSQNGEGDARHVSRSPSPRPRPPSAPWAPWLAPSVGAAAR